MTLTLDIPADMDAPRRLRLASALYETGLLPRDEAAVLAGIPPSDLPHVPERAAEQPRLRQGSPEWKAELRRIGERVQGAVPLSLEATSREALYGDDMR